MPKSDRDWKAYKASKPEDRKSWGVKKISRRSLPRPGALACKSSAARWVSYRSGGMKKCSGRLTSMFGSTTDGRDSLRCHLRRNLATANKNAGAIKNNDDGSGSGTGFAVTVTLSMKPRSLERGVAKTAK